MSPSSGYLCPLSASCHGDKCLGGEAAWAQGWPPVPGAQGTNLAPCGERVNCVGLYKPTQLNKRISEKNEKLQLNHVRNCRF